MKWKIKIWSVFFLYLIRYLLLALRRWNGHKKIMFMQIFFCAYCNTANDWQFQTLTIIQTSRIWKLYIKNDWVFEFKTQPILNFAYQTIPDENACQWPLTETGIVHRILCIYYSIVAEAININFVTKLSIFVIQCTQSDSTAITVAFCIDMQTL